MSSSLIPAKWQATPTGIRVAGALTSMKNRNAALRQESKHALSPVMATAATQAGAAAAGAASVYAGARAPAVVLGIGLVGIVLGSVQERPELVAAGNGALAVLTAQKVAELLRGTTKTPAQTQSAA